MADKSAGGRSSAPNRRFCPSRRLDARALDELAARLWPRLQGRCGIFAYGSLIWRPTFAAAFTAPAVIYGYARQPCILSTAYRGTERAPGPVYGLDRGGSCAGLVLGLPVKRRRQALRATLAQEMFLNAYHPRLVRARHCGSSAQTLCLTFVANRASPHYHGSWQPAQLRRMVNTARGRRGSCREYWLQTLRHLQQHRINWPLGAQIIDAE